MSRVARIIRVGHPHHVVQRGNNKQKIFFTNDDREKYLFLLRKYSNENSCRVLAYCLMDNHVHMLSIPEYDNSLARTMQKISLTFTQYINKKYNRTGRLWECRYYSTLVDKEVYLLAVCRYIEQNPVRANIVDSPLEYKWSSGRANTTRGVKSFIRPICDEYGIDRAEYKKLLHLPCDVTDIRMIKNSTMSGKPMGSKTFVDSIAKSLGIEMPMRTRGRPSKNKNKNRMCP